MTWVGDVKYDVKFDWKICNFEELSSGIISRIKTHSRRNDLLHDETIWLLKCLSVFKGAKIDGAKIRRMWN